MVRLPVLFEIDLKAPLSFCYSWLTDYQPTDKDLNPALSARKVVERTHEFVRIVDESLGTPYNKRTSTIWLHPPDAWDAEAEGTIYDYDLHYRLTSEAKATRLTIAGVTVTKPMCPFKTREENNQRFVKGWGHYKEALEKDYAASPK